VGRSVVAVAVVFLLFTQTLLQKSFCSPSTTNLGSSDLSSFSNRCTASCPGAESWSADNADARVSHYYAEFYESAFDEVVDVAGASVKRTRIDDSVMEYFHVDAKGKPADAAATQIVTISSAEPTIALLELNFATPPKFTAPITTNDVTSAGASVD
jgi:hypothetical protein